MKSSFIARMAALVAVFTLVAPFAHAGQKADSGSVKRTVTIKYDATIDGQKIAPGNYEFEVTSDAEPILVIKQKKQDVARVRVDRQSQPLESGYDQVRFRTTDSGAKEIVGVIFRGSREAFVIRNGETLATKTNP